MMWYHTTTSYTSRPNVNLDDSFNFMFDFAYGFNHNFEIDFDLNIVVDSVFAVFHHGLRHPHI